MTCGHTPEVIMSWLGHNEERREVKACECCAAMVWDRLAPVHRDSFTIEPIYERRSA